MHCLNLYNLPDLHLVIPIMKEKVSVSKYDYRFSFPLFLSIYTSCILKFVNRCMNIYVLLIGRFSYYYELFPYFCNALVFKSALSDINIIIPVFLLLVFASFPILSFKNVQHIVDLVFI